MVPSHVAMFAFVKPASASSPNAELILELPINIRQCEVTRTQI